MPLITALESLRQQDNHELKVNLFYVISYRPEWEKLNAAFIE